MKIIELKEIGATLMQIDHEQMLLTRLLTQGGLRSAFVYRREVKRIAKLRKRAFQNLEQMAQKRYWKNSHIKDNA